MENKTVTKTLETGRHRVSKLYDNNTKRYLPLPIRKTLVTNVDPSNIDILDILTIIQKNFDNSEWIGIIDNYIILNDDSNYLQSIDSILNDKHDQYIKGILLDNNLNELHGISTSIILHITNQWVYTKSGSLYKLLKKLTIDTSRGVNPL